MCTAGAMYLDEEDYEMYLESINKGKDKIKDRDD